MTETTEKKTSNFIRTIIDKDLESGKHQSVRTRFPPEPNGYLHIGHAKAICVNFGLAQDYEGSCNLRFDDTNPLKEDVEFEEVIKEDITWLGFKWANLYTASGYFDQLHDYAVELIRQGKAYVDSLSAEQIREYRGTLKAPGKDSPHRNRSIEENLDLFKRMREGEFDEGAHILRAKIDMASPNMNMRDPTLYRIRKVDHHHTGNKWCIYPMYDYTHCISDALENITHSLCSLEFEDHRPLYDWVLNQLTDLSHPQQIEFARLNVSYTIVGKRYLRDLVEGGEVDGWEDPRMPTLRGYRRRGYTPASIRNFCERAGLSKSNSVVDVAMLEHAIREDLDRSAPRAMAVLRPIKVTITSYEDGKVENLQAPVHPQDESRGHRTLPFSKELYIDQDDFMEDPPKKYFRLAPGQEVRLRNSYVIKCEEVIKNAAGEVVELRCSHDPATLGANPEGRKVKGIIHWLSAQHAVPATIRLYDRLFNHEDPLSDKDNFKSFLNPDSLEIVKGAFVEPSLASIEPESRFQFERTGYFVADRYDCKPGDLVFNRVVSLRDSWK